MCNTAAGDRSTNAAPNAPSDFESAFSGLNRNGVIAYGPAIPNPTLSFDTFVAALVDPHGRFPRGSALLNLGAKFTIYNLQCDEML
jgi:hypothetical protein